MRIFENIKEFDWDEGNIDKNEKKHNIKWYECEQIFFNKPLLFLDDETHSIDEKRYYAYGRTDVGKSLAVVFTVRNNKIRIISARSMSRQERRCYEEQEKA
jgi:uncharacterized DUF497 family protein